MRILLCNKFYYRRGGDCIYTLNLERLLEQHGHPTAVFAMQHPDNLPSPWLSYFPTEVKFGLGGSMAEAFRRPLGSPEVEHKFTALLDAFRPDVVHLGNIHSQLSPLIGEIAHQRGIRVVWTLHDYKLFCPRYDCLQSGKTPCSQCSKSPTGVLRHRCMKDSYMASVMAWLEARRWNRRRLENSTDAFICPSAFMAKQMEAAGFDVAKLNVLHNFVSADEPYTPRTKDDYICYVGRLSHEKGVATLIRAIRQLGAHAPRLMIAGTGPQEKELRQLATGTPTTFLGHCSWEQLKDVVGHALCAVAPSEWYENNPLSIIEAFCLGTPVVGADIGGIPELIDETNGMLFPAGDVSSLARSIETMQASGHFDSQKIASNARQAYSAEKYYDRLMQTYQPTSQQ